MSAIYASCDTSQIRQSASAGTMPHPNLVLTTTILASSLSFIDGSIVNVGLPSIGAAFRSDASSLQWVINAYLLPLSALLLLGGAAGDRFGRMRLMITGTALFGVASLACALAPSIAWLLAARALQGIGSAMLMPNSLAILGAGFSGKARGKAVGIWASVSALMGALGPVLGGWLIDTAGWRMIFLINLPLAAGAIALAALFIQDGHRKYGGPTLDLGGGLLSTASLGLFTWALTIGSGTAGWTILAILPGVLGIALLVPFFATERVKGDAAMVPLGLFGSTSFIGLTLLTLFLYGALGAFMILVPYTLIQGMGFSGAAAGASLLPFALVLTLASPFMGSIAGRIGSRILLSIGPLVVACGFLLLLGTSPWVGYWGAVFPAVLIVAIGMAMAVAPLTTAVLESVDARHTGSASGFNSAIARAGGVIATALLGGVLNRTGMALFAAFQVAAVACTLASIAASASAYFLVKPMHRKAS